MYISTSNILTTDNTTITADGSSVPVSYMLNRDFSEIYRCGTTSSTFRILMTVPGIKYIGLAGLDVYGICSTVAFEYWNGSEYVVAKTHTVDSNATIMFVNIANQSAQRWRITFTKLFSNLQVGIAYLAAGDCWEVPNGGEESGYARPWTTPAYAQRVQTNLGMPTASVIESVGVKGTLSLSNVLTTTVVSTWVPLQGYAVREGVFIVEDRTYVDRAYYCYDCEPSAVKAHSQTRSLQNVSLKFSAWTGRTI